MEMKIFDMIASVHFDKESFCNLIDADQRLDSESLHHYWGEYVLYSKENLITFYRSLDNSNPTPAYIRESMNRFFDSKAIDFLHSKDLI